MKESMLQVRKVSQFWSFFIIFLIVPSYKSVPSTNLYVRVQFPKDIEKQWTNEHNGKQRKRSDSPILPLYMIYSRFPD